jgi:micrococcal nuclease
MRQRRIAIFGAAHMNPITLYHYKAIVRSAYDGDTITVDIDLGLHTWVHGEKLRLYRINAPELTGATKAAGRASRDFLRSIVIDKEIFIETIKDEREKYGRYLAEVWLQDADGVWQNINDMMVQAGHAVYATY